MCFFRHHFRGEIHKMLFIRWKIALKTFIGLRENETDSSLFFLLFVLLHITSMVFYYIFESKSQIYKSNWNESLLQPQSYKCYNVGTFGSCALVRYANSYATKLRVWFQRASFRFFVCACASCCYFISSVFIRFFNLVHTKFHFSHYKDRRFLLRSETSHLQCTTKCVVRQHDQTWLLSIPHTMRCHFILYMHSILSLALSISLRCIMNRLLQKKMWRICFDEFVLSFCRQLPCCGDKVRVRAKT